ncbi:ADP-heptose--LPS heptosyltransferase [Desulfuromonas versatilis]|uniref:lipopolysaccharide heptosyltransferase II n=1 Tax=Desulfuromonas versatilis TaxID=2802975 RepID=A0ABM8HQC5_9BACT|nr:lipopolysaccharide heptosyltransferase II [Desulfuromonas versatilis]BCR05199.1 ADP-heptose--LPS heptosyltransferase [Desulfuromonas versatilis]
MKPLKNNDIRRILVRSTNWIGDAVMTTPALGALRAHFPNATISVVANPLVAELFRHHPYCDEVLVFDKKGAHQGWRGMLRFCGQLRQGRFDLAILLQNAIEAGIMAALAGIPRRAGFRTDGRGFLLSHAVPISEADKKLHHTRYYLTMLERLGISGGDGLLRLESTAEESAWAESTLGDGEWMAINPGAAYGSAKRWIPERFAAVGDQLAREFGVKVLLTGGPGEREIGRDIARAMTCGPLNLIGETSVRQMMALLSRCRLMVTNDSGPMHVAAAFAVPIVAVFGPTDHTTTSPLAETCRIIRKHCDCAPCLLRECPLDHRCMTAISADDVLEGARSLLNKTR